MSLGRELQDLKPVNGFATTDDGAGQAHPPMLPEFGAGSKAAEFFLGAPSTQTSAKPQGSGGASESKGKGKKKATAPAAGPSSPSQGTYISVYDYFQQSTYLETCKWFHAQNSVADYPNITITDTSLPVINVGDRQNPSYLPPDVCIVLPGQPSRSKLTPAQTQQIIRCAVRKPHQNAQSIATNAPRMLGFDPTNATLVHLIQLMMILQLKEVLT
ncbi:hypothetical protein LTS18_006596 [Coniosporium uncinatum]|uniref:Uncharacterized protein n=1 Tax=Coniosporium uncinatum TaxID=93489 RepID=A0ACC3DQE2_9PEZI|nr:hypothetical protein LTS18_006596 [Coniosporium uncinatum]